MTTTAVTSGGVVIQPASFRHGIHPDEHKERTEHLEVERLPFVSSYILPLSQHLGAPCRAVVTAGQSVTRGQMIAEPGGFVSPTLHSPVAGRVANVGSHRHPNGSMVQAIEIKADPFDDQTIHGPAGSTLKDWYDLSTDDFIARVQQSGLVGMGGAAFPTHVKYKLPDGKRCERLVINGCECEPYLTCDHRLMVEQPDAVVQGACMVATKLNADQVVIGVELNKLDAIVALEEACDRYRDQATQAGRPIAFDLAVMPLKVKYPQGAEKMLIKALFGEEVPAGKLPLDLNIVVNNVGSMAAISDYFLRSQPVIERLLTVSGSGVIRPANLLVPIGTPVREVLQHCGLRTDTRQVIMGGPMMGQPLASLDVPVLKGTSGLLAFTEREVVHSSEYACVRCGRCLEACGNFLNPSRLARLARVGRLDELNGVHIMDCVECGACTFTCPSGIPIVHLIRAAKSAIRARQAKERRNETKK
ncbi:MAG: electron transport complex subunit RsxC [Planctomycetes bacterium]|nr:electron transport complex subunit RsxC [Planctomycetota bacterium]NOG55844.1 electron transport complex subunit RsxC [Planctomycetota bacterium]